MSYAHLFQMLSDPPPEPFTEEQEDWIEALVERRITDTLQAYSNERDQEFLELKAQIDAAVSSINTATEQMREFMLRSVGDTPQRALNSLAGRS